MEKKSSLKDILHSRGKYEDYEYPLVSVIIPTYDCCEKISPTIESILNQDYPSLEIIVVDNASQDRTLRVVKNFHDDRISIYSVSGYERYEILNKGISQAKGEYINCLFPGDFYVHGSVLLEMMELALENKKPDLVYCGTLIRDGVNDPKILYRPLSIKNLKKGRQPTSLQSCWFLADLFEKLGKFDTTLTIRGGFELMCRIVLNPKLRVASSNKILTDYDLRHITRSMVNSHFFETMRAIRTHFGIVTAIKWLWFQRDLRRVIRIWFRSIKAAFIRG